MNGMENKQIIETIKANSFCGRYDGVGSDFKVYFDTIDELKNGIKNVIDGRKYLKSLKEVEIQ